MAYYLLVNKTLKFILVSVFLFGLSTGISYSFFHFRKTNQGSNVIAVNPTNTPAAKKSKIDPSIPKTEICPLNGALFTKQEQAVWSTHRPLAVMIENSVDARPQSGLGSADVVYEAVAEGGITRFMAMFYCDAALTDNLMVAPVRSARIYFVNLVSEYDALYNHVGGAGNCDDPNVDDRAKALCLIDRVKIKNLDQMGYAGDFKVCHRVADRLNKEVAYEHTMACFVDNLYAKADSLKWGYTDANGVAWDKNFVPWKFLSSTDTVTGTPAKSISYMFWEQNRPFNQNFDVSWSYDEATKSYQRSNAGQVSVDLNSGDPLKFKTVIVQYTKQTFVGDLEMHLLYDVIGKGKALVFENGVAIEGTWSKASRTGRTVYKDAKGVEVKLNPGPIWISILPDANTVSYN
jgi:hypothetical protein